MEYLPIALPLFYYKKRENDIFQDKLMAERRKRVRWFSFIIMFFKMIYLFFVVGENEARLSIDRENERK